MSVSDARSCTQPTERLEGGRKASDVDKIYGKLQFLSLKAKCDQQYDPPIEGFATASVRTETAKFIYVLALGLAALSFWRSVR
jgi:hypothetical protein